MTDIISVQYLDSFDINSHHAWSNLRPNKIKHINWEAFPYAPEVTFRIIHNGNYLFVRFDVKEEYPVRRCNAKDQDPVYQDSCVEVFILDKANRYHNFECNASGVLLSAYGEHRTGRKKRNFNELKKILRIPSDIKKEGAYFYWNLVIGIPFASVGMARGHSYRANFYKCGDLTEKKHYLSWSSIATQNPDFHCPEYFGTIVIE